MANDDDTLDRLIAAEVKLARPAHEDLLAALVTRFVRRCQDGRIKVVNEQGHERIKLDGSGRVVPMAIDDLIAEIRSTKPALFEASPIDQPPASEPDGMSQPTTLTERMVLANRDAGFKQKLLAELNGKQGVGRPGKNPWLKGSWNLTEQMRLLNTDPTLAARYRHEAEAA